MDVTIRSPRDKNPALSALMQAKGRLKVGEVLNACPYGCTEEDLDERGLCRHLVGYTNHSEAECKAGKGEMEPLVLIGDQRQVHVKREKRSAVGLDGKKMILLDGPPILEKVLPGDILVQITTSSRVYRNVDEKKQSA